MDIDCNFNYWKHPLQKGALFTLIVLTFFMLCAESYEFYFLASDTEKISELFNRGDWENYASYKYFKFAQEFFMLFMLSAIFLIGCTSKNREIAYKREGICWISASFYWCIVYGILGDKFETIDFVMWILLFTATLGNGIYLFKKFEKIVNCK